MREALEALPGVEKGSIDTDVAKKQARFKVSDPKRFKVADAIKAIKEAGFDAKLTKAGSTITP